MRTLNVIAAAAVMAGSTFVASPGWAKTAFQYWAQGEGAYVSSKDHPSELYDFFNGVAAGDGVPPPYYNPYNQPMQAYPYGDPGY